MNELAFVDHGDVFTDSMVIAKGTGNEHESVTAMLKKYWSDFEESRKIDFSDLKSGKRGRPTRVYLLNEEQAMLLITYLNNTIEVRRFKKELIRQFIAMRRLLLERQTAEWQQARLESKDFRKMVNDTIKELVPYAFAQGSTHPDKLYEVYAKLIKGLAGYESLDLAGAETLSTVSMLLRVLHGIILQEMARSIHYKVIYQTAKIRLIELAALMSTPRLTA